MLHFVRCRGFVWKSPLVYIIYQNLRSYLIKIQLLKKVALNSFTLFFFRRVFRLTFEGMLASYGILSCMLFLTSNIFLVSRILYIIIRVNFAFMYACVYAYLYVWKFCLRNGLKILINFFYYLTVLEVREDHSDGSHIRENYINVSFWSHYRSIDLNVSESRISY